MTTTKQDGTAATGETAAPVLGEIIVKTHDGARCVAWTLGHHGAVRGLTVAGIAAAARASAEFLEDLGDGWQELLGSMPGLTQLRIGTTEWSMPLVPTMAADIEAMMIEVVNADGSIGPVG